MPTRLKIFCLNAISVTDMDEPRQLILRAFQQAWSSDKPDWYRMTTAVLKNRMLSLTDGTFSEANYRAKSFMDFLSQYEDITTLDRSRFPPVVVLQEGERSRIAPLEPGRGTGRPRIRSDLWQAILDYASEQTYVWDVTAKRARPRNQGEEHPEIPTITSEGLQQWRVQFVDTLTSSAEVHEEELARLSNWRDNRLATSALPPRLAHQWNGYLRDRVQERLRGWFSDHSLEEPSDLIVSQRPRAASPSDVDDLRQLVINVVTQMTEQELSSLVLPPRAVLRAMAGRRQR